MSELEQRIRDIDLLCSDLYERLTELSQLDTTSGQCVAESLIHAFNTILSGTPLDEEFPF